MSEPPVHPILAQALAGRGYAVLTPVQEQVLRQAAGGRDLLVSARTGSGKTVAYGLAIGPDLLGDFLPGAVEPTRLEPAGAPLALVIAPTRELALQVQRELEWLYAGAGGRVVSCVGGMDPRREARELADGAHIVVGTPGRLRDHLERGQLQTLALRVVVLDEADEMLDLGFREELEEILGSAPPERRTLLFSATLPRPIIALAQRYQRDAVRIEVGGGEGAHADIDYRAVRVAPSDVEHAVVNLLRLFEAEAALVFCSTREAVRRLHANLVERGFSVVALSGELSQTERTHALQALRDRRARVCVATDVAARGIDIPDLELVIHADLPHDAEVLQHRSGRTGRAGRKGVSALLAPHPKRRRLEQLLRAAKVEATWMAAPTAEEIRALDQTRLLDLVLPAGEDEAAARDLLAQRGAEDVAAALIRLNRARLPAPEDLIEAGPEPAYGAPRGADRDGERGADRDGGRPPSRSGFEGSTWFRINIGRNKNADPRWLLPLICRRGHVTKKDVGAIRVFERDTRFEVSAAVAERFAEALRGGDDDGGRIERLDEAGPLPPRDRKPSAKPRREGAYGSRAVAAEEVKPAKPVRSPSKNFGAPRTGEPKAPRDYGAPRGPSRKPRPS